MADYGLRVFVVLNAARAGEGQRDSAWHLATALSMFPSIFLVPLYGAAGNSFPKRTVLVGTTAYTTLILTAFAWWGQGWMVCVGLVALGSALYGPTRHALLPAAAQDTRWPLPRVRCVWLLPHETTERSGRSFLLPWQS